MVRCGVGADVEEHLPNHSKESQNRENFAKSSGMGSDAQPMVEFHNGHPIDFMEGVQSLERAEKVIGEAALRRIWMGDSGKDASGPEGYGYSTNGEPPNAKVNSVSQAGGEVQCTDKL